MSDENIFVDTNILCYLFGEDPSKAERSEDLLRSGATISTQVLAELTNVARKKAKLAWPHVDMIIDLACASCNVQPITPEIFHMAKTISRNHQLTIFDAQIIAAALACGATTLWSEDMQHGQVFERRVTIKNPFL
jgi:predicted nucleic acid-binding protein